MTQSRALRFFGTPVALCIIFIGVLYLPTRHVATPYGVYHATVSKPSAVQPVSFNKTKYSTTDSTSLWVIVNKQHPLNPKTYVPSLVVPTILMRNGISSDEHVVGASMAPDLERMVSAAKASGLSLNLQSGYRSYQFQASLYNSYVVRDGQAVADRESARPGYSEHQTGLAADLGGISVPSCNVAACFGTTIEGEWLAAHAYEYGFIIRYTTVKEAITGYENEPWHVRYIGTLLAGEMHHQGITTLEEFFNSTGGQSY
jgi:D-alanyl-D-alanine carboxypeptidase